MNIFINILLVMSVIIAIVTLWLLQNDQREHFEERVWDATQRCTQKSVSPYNPACPSSNLNYSPLLDTSGNTINNVILKIGEKIASPSGTVELYFTLDGNLVLQRNNFDKTFTKLWESQTSYCIGTYASSDEKNAYCVAGNITLPFVEELRPAGNPTAPPIGVSNLATKLILSPTADKSNGELRLVSDTGLVVKSLASLDVSNLQLQVRDEGTLNLVNGGVTKWTVGTPAW